MKVDTGFWNKNGEYIESIEELTMEEEKEIMKEIIIDGIDVAECNAYKEGHCLDKTAILLCDTNKCSNYNNCYYKQLKRLQAENEELKKEITKLSDPRYQIMKVNEGYYNRMKTYKQALEEIREIAENYFEECGVPDDYFKRNNYSWKQHQIKGLTCKLQQIFDKISEVLKEGE